MTILAVYHIKGGVGKTATAVNLAYLAAASGMKTLLCDLDPQSSATFYFRIKPRFKAGSKGFVKGGKHLARNLKGTDYDNLDLLPADVSHRHLTRVLEQVKGSKQRLRRVLEPFREAYEIIFLDCPPTLTIMAENVLDAADYLLVPVIPSTLAVRSYEQLCAFCSKQHYEQRKILPFFSMVEKAKTLHRILLEQLPEQHDNMLSCRIPYLSDIEKMGLRREPVMASVPRSRAAQAYMALWQELQERLRTDGSTVRHRGNASEPDRRPPEA